MGRQVGFYMTPGDEREFLSGIRTTDRVELVSERSADGTPFFVDTFPEQGTSKAIEGLVLYNADADLRMVFSKHGDQFFLDKDRSAVIELRQSVVRRGQLERGRIWVATEDEHGPKSAAFLAWYGRVAQWIKQRYQKDERGHYVGPGAATLLNE